MTTITLPVAPETVTVSGYREKPTSYRWTGLDLSQAVLRTQSTLMLVAVGPDEAPYDLHLDVPFTHPMMPEERDLRHRVRPRPEPGRKWRGRMVKDVRFVKQDGAWVIEVECE